MVWNEGGGTGTTSNYFSYLSYIPSRCQTTSVILGILGVTLANTSTFRVLDIELLGIMLRQDLLITPSYQD